MRKPRGRQRSAVILVLAGGGLCLLVAAGCKNSYEAPAPPTCAPVAPPACLLHDGGGDAPFVPCVSDECSLATLDA
ncbi:MAG TPA: hypothetical protein VGI39_15585, partial [Polyangiaceae bacterium]